MSVDQYQKAVNGLDKEIADLEKKKAAKDKDIASLQNKIVSTQKSINKNTSQSFLNSKRRQIASCESDIAKKSKDSAELGKKIAEKRKKRSDAYLKLQKEQQNEQKKQDRASQRLQASYENRIDELQQQLAKSVVLPQQNNSESEEEYDVFVSHAWEDKEDFVDEFVDELKKQGFKVWYDTNKLKWGDSMREKIDKGLAKSRYGVVVLSPNYIAEHKYWTKAELNGLFQVESINGKVILPIWHNLTKKQVVEYSNRINALEAQVSAQTKTLDEYRAQDSDKEAQAQSAASTSESYENLMTVSSQYESGEYSDATLADTLLNVNRDALGQSGQALYDELSTEIFPGACETKYQNGMAALNVANYETAIDALGKVVRMDEQYDSGAALLNLGIAYMRSGDNENAKTYFNRVAELFPGTENEATAKSNLNSMGDTTADDTKTADDTQE